MKILPFFLFAVAQVSQTFVGIASASDLPNVIIVMTDDMGYGDVGCYNRHSKISTPYIDSLARDGMRFTDAHASGPLCHLSRYGLMTGQYPFRGKPEKWSTEPTIKEDQLTLPSMMQKVGYATSMVGKWHLGFAQRGYENPMLGGPIDRGFDSFFGIRASTDIPPYFYIRGNKAVSPPTQTIDANYSDGWSKIQGAFWRAGGISPNLQLKDVLPRFTKEAINVIDAHASSDTDKPLMLYLAYPAPHTPWLPSAEFQGRSSAGMYGDFAMMVDHNVGQVLNAVKAAGLSDNTLVIFTSDNGPVWYDSDTQRLDHDSSGGLRGMKSDAWEAGHRMPFIVRWPGHVEAGAVADQMVSFVDVMSTLAAITDFELPASAAPDSFSFLSALLRTEPEKLVRKELVLKSGGGHMTVRSGDWKFIDKLGSGGFTKPSKIKPVADGPNGQLFNLAQDLGETNNLYLEHPEIVEQLTKRLNEVVSASAHRLVE